MNYVRASTPMVRRRRGMGAATQANANAGTYSDINCPGSCYLLGNVLDMSILGQECWPCHNVCPSGTVWDTAAMACSSNPSAPNPVTPTTQDSSDPATACAAAFGTYDPNTGVCTTITSQLGTYLPWILGGLALLMLAPLATSRGRY